MAITGYVKELADYAIYHFRTEEEIWHEHLPDDPLNFNHKKVHDQFVQAEDYLSLPKE